MEFISKRYFERLQGSRTKERFLLFPKFVNGSWKWLEKAKWVECYSWKGWYTAYWDD